MRLKESQKRDLAKVKEELTREYSKILENDFVYKPMSYTLYHLWQIWDNKENPRAEEQVDGSFIVRTEKE